MVNQQVLFKHAAALPPGKRTGVLIAGWGPVVLFPFVPILYFYDWRYSPSLPFSCIFWAGMGRKFAQAAVLRQCATDGGFLKSALSVGLVRPSDGLWARLSGAAAPERFRRPACGPDEVEALPPGQISIRSNPAARS